LLGKQTCHSVAELTVEHDDKVTQDTISHQWNLWKEQSKRWVFRRFLLTGSDGADVTFCGRDYTFHRISFSGSEQSTIESRCVRFGRW